ncbi:hypothetical protein Pelo_18372 [Pelomyxa schiedti]|nr:hypothetical protein Pelo_18372 [Pelomyxa schiedti]
MRECSKARKKAIAAILERGPPWAAPNPHSMATYCTSKEQGRSYTSLLGPYRGTKRAPFRGVRGPDGAWRAPEERVPGLTGGDGPAMEGAMRGFHMTRPEINDATVGLYNEEPECMRPNTSGLPPLIVRVDVDETEIQCVESRIKWFRQRKCVGWARGLMASGRDVALLSAACKHAWSEWFPKQTRVLMKHSPAWKLILRSCKTTASRSIAFLCGAHPRAGKDSPLLVLGSDILVSILMLCRGFNNCSDLDGLQREPRQTEFEASLTESYWHSLHRLLTSVDKFQVLAFGNFNPVEHKSGMAFCTVLSAYTLLYDFGPWVALDDFVTAVELGNVGNLQCFAFFRSGAYFHTPQERFMAIRLHETLFGTLNDNEESKFLKCFTGHGFVAMADV